MNRVPLITANAWVIVDELVAVGLERSDYRGGRGIWVDVWSYQGWRQWGIGIGITQGGFQLGWGRGNARAGTDQEGGSAANKLRSFFGAGKIAGQLYFPLAPRLLLAAGEEGKGSDMIIAELSNRLIIGIRQDHLGALIIHLCNGAEFVVADN